MAKFHVKISLDDGTVVDNVAVQMADALIAPLTAACEELGQVDSEGVPLTGGRAITYSLRWFLTERAKMYAARKDSELAAQMGNAAALSGFLNELEVIENPEE